jgi:hypothetical protein
MLGFYENFPETIHRIEVFKAFMSIKSVQQKLIHVLHSINLTKFSFEQVSCPTVPECSIIFEAGLADAGSFTYIDEEETRKALTAVRKSPFHILDVFCAVRYYKGTVENKTPLKFDYYLIRLIFDKNTVEIQVFHDRGPRYISPEDIIAFLVNEVNKNSSRKTLKRVEAYP